MSVSTEIQFLMSGSGADGLGGVISAARIASQAVSAITMTGVSFMYAQNNAAGDGTLRLTAELGIQPDGSLNANTTNAVPIMTSNVAPSGTVFFSGVYSGSFDGWNAFDGSASSGWLENGSTGHIGYEFPTAKIINKSCSKAARHRRSGFADLSPPARRPGTMTAVFCVSV
ncbi:MAG: hypothetical protein GY862_29725 [Gammaproteobacteria bacterium]|nr:hypothetical protein [Gammaproteobacteria bacterium]